MKKKILGLVAAIFLVAGVVHAADEGVVASKGGDKYHKPTCGMVKNIKAENVLKYATTAEAEKAGYSACKICFKDKAPAAKPALVGSKDSDKYHKPTCKMAANIKEDKLVGFASEDEAKKAGYKPCSVCFPAEKKAEAPKVEVVKAEAKKDVKKKDKK